jgi:hypothetical protein
VIFYPWLYDLLTCLIIIRFRVFFFFFFFFFFFCEIIFIKIILSCRYDKEESNTMFDVNSSS